MINAHLEEDYNERSARAEEFESRRERVLSSLAKKLQIESNIDEIATCVAFAYNNDVKGTITLAERLLLSQADMYLILEDEVSYLEEIANEGL